jgi:hypothetical protein
MAKVTNINGTSDSKCKCGSWIEHWENFNGGQSRPTYCSEKTCTKKDLVGAHVQKADSTDKKWYIIPLCTEHNKSTSDLELVIAINFAPANKQETCEK